MRKLPRPPTGALPGAIAFAAIPSVFTCLDVYSNLPSDIRGQLNAEPLMWAIVGAAFLLIFLAFFITAVGVYWGAIRLVEKTLGSLRRRFQYIGIVIASAAILPILATIFGSLLTSQLYAGLRMGLSVAEFGVLGALVVCGLRERVARRLREDIRNVF